MCLILDEPTAGLDPAGRESILENIRAYQAAQHAAVIMVSHSHGGRWRPIADRLLVMNDGDVVMQRRAAGGLRARGGAASAMGLAVPQVTQVSSARCAQLGRWIDPASVFTVEQAVQAAAPLLKGGRAMLKDVTLGQYFPGETLIHQLDPRTKLLLVDRLYRGAVSGKVVCRPMALVAGVPGGGASRISQIHLKVIVKGLKPLLLIIVLTALLNLFYAPGRAVLVQFWIFKITKAGHCQAPFSWCCASSLLVAGTFHADLYHLAPSR